MVPTDGVAAAELAAALASVLKNHKTLSDGFRDHLDGLATAWSGKTGAGEASTGQGDEHAISRRLQKSAAEKEIAEKELVKAC